MKPNPDHGIGDKLNRESSKKEAKSSDFFQIPMMHTGDYDW